MLPPEFHLPGSRPTLRKKPAIYVALYFRKQWINIPFLYCGNCKTRVIHHSLDDRRASFIRDDPRLLPCRISGPVRTRGGPTVLFSLSETQGVRRPLPPTSRPASCLSPATPLTDNYSSRPNQNQNRGAGGCSRRYKCSPSLWHIQSTLLDYPPWR